MPRVPIHLQCFVNNVLKPLLYLPLMLWIPPYTILYIVRHCQICKLLTMAAKKKKNQKLNSLLNTDIESIMLVHLPLPNLPHWLTMFPLKASQKVYQENVLQILIKNTIFTNRQLIMNILDHIYKTGTNGKHPSYTPVYESIWQSEYSLVFSD